MYTLFQEGSVCMGKSSASVDVVLTFDTTGSMYPCLTQVRRSCKETVKRLFKDVDGLRVGVIAHGDYCDAGSSYVTKILDLTDDEKKVVSFIDKVEPTGGGDSPECYELVLNQARTLKWTSGKSKVLVMIGDDVPHGPTYPDNKKKIDWRNELGLLLEAGINVYGVHAMPGCRKHSKSFYEEIAKKTGGFYLTLDQFATINDLIMAVCYKQGGDEQLQGFEKEVKETGRMNRNIDKIISILLGRKPAFAAGDASLHAVPAGRFQILPVDKKQGIADFVRDQGVEFKKGRGFYELTKAETVHGYKEIVLMDKKTGDIFNGAKVREMLELPPQAERKGEDREDVKLRPVSFEKYAVFIQSTSANRALVAGTRLLYEVPDWDKSEEAA